LSKNVAVFVDVANIFYAAKAAGVDIDYVTLLKASSAGRDLVRAYAYTGLDPENENQRNFHEFLRRHGYKVVSKDIRKYGDGKVKANLDIELVVDMLKTARNLDIAIVVSGDGDFASAIRAVQEMGVRVEVISFRGNTSSDLMDVADVFTDITQVAKVEKGSSRSGRRVAGDEEDLSMTEVPEKQSEGTGERRGRGRSRRPAATEVKARRGSTAAAPAGASIVALPGEKLSKVAASAEPVDAAAEAETPEAGEPLPIEPGEGDDAGRRRRRRRGGRGRGRGRSHEGLEEQLGDSEGETERLAEPVDLVPARPGPSTFGSVWDSQIGISPAAARPASLDEAEEDFDEPPIPEYLIAERRRESSRNQGRGGRGRGGAYAAALERERFGGGRGSQVSRFAEPSRPREAAGRQERPPRRAPAPARSLGEEPWSEVPPEIEAMLRAQLGTRSPAAAARSEAKATAPASEAAAPPEARPRAARRPRRSAEAATAPAASSEVAGGTMEPPAAPEQPAAQAPARGRRRTAPAASEPVSAEAAGPAGGEAPKRRARTSRITAASEGSAAPPESGAVVAEAPAEKPKRWTTRRKAETTAG
jgi:uncharacterized LabA/DUF88 family protein